MATRHHARGRVFGHKTGAHWETAANALGDRHHIGGNAGPFIGKQPAGPAHAALHLVEKKKQPVFVGDLAQSLKVILLGGPDPALALHRFDQKCRGFVPDRRPGFVEITEADMIEALDSGLEALEQLFLAAGGDGGEGASVEGLGRADDAVTPGIASRVEMGAHGLDAAFHRLGA